MSDVFELLGAALCFAGSLFFLAGAIGLLRLPDFFTRLHAPTKAATLGIMLMALGSTVHHIREDVVVWPEDLLILLFVMLTTPVSSQVLARAAVACGIAGAREIPGEEPSAEGVSAETGRG